MVGVNTLLIKEGSPSDVLTLPKEEKRGGSLLISHLNVAPSSSWRNVLILGLQRDKYLVNRILTHFTLTNTNNATSSPLGKTSFSTLVTSGKEIEGPEYTLEVSIGTPAKKQLIEIDTLSSLSWIQCDP